MARRVSKAGTKAAIMHPYLTSTRNFSATSSKKSVCGACNANAALPSDGIGCNCLGWCVVCGSFKPHIGGSSSWGEDSSTVGKTVSPIQISRNTRVVLVVRTFWRRSRGALIGGLSNWRMAGSRTLEMRRGSYQAWRSWDSSSLSHNRCSDLQRMECASSIWYENPTFSSMKIICFPSKQDILHFQRSQYQ